MLTSSSELVRKILKADRALSAAPVVKCKHPVCADRKNSRFGGMLSQGGTTLSRPLTIDGISQQKRRSADPVDLSQLVVDLRSRHLTYWRQFSSYHP
eukprot:1157347-Pelagomonas_calceolata.AAC.6